MHTYMFPRGQVLKWWMAPVGLLLNVAGPDNIYIYIYIYMIL